MDNEKLIAGHKEEKYQVLFGIHKPTFDRMLVILEMAYAEMRKRGGFKRSGGYNKLMKKITIVLFLLIFGIITGCASKINDADMTNAFDRSGGFSEGYQRVCIGGKWGFISADGNIAVPLVYDYVGDFRNGYVPVMLDDRWGVVAFDGNIVVPVIYDYYDRFVAGHIVALLGDTYLDENNFCVHDGEWVIIDTAGNAIKPFLYDTNAETSIFIGRLFDGAASVWLSGECVCLDVANYTAEKSVITQFWGSTLYFTQPPTVRNGYIFYPFEELVLAFYGTLSWDSDNFISTGMFNNNIIEIPINDLCYEINGERLETSVELLPFVENHTIYAHLDYVVEGFGLSFIWNGDTRIINVPFPH